MKGQSVKENKIEYTVFSRQVVDEQFNKILTTINRDLPPSEISKAIHKILVNRTMIAATYDKKSPSLTLYRVTTEYPEFNKDDPDKYSHPPPVNKKGEKCSAGRANIEGKPLLYTALDPFTAIKEMESYLEPEKSFYISVWNLKFLKKTVAHTLVLNSRNSNTDSILHFMAKSHEEGLRTMIKGLPNIEFQEGFIHAVKKMGDLFTASGKDIYPLTSAYAHEIIYDGIKSPLIVYPSVLNDQQSINIAMRPDFVVSESVKMTDIYEVSYAAESLTNESVNIKIYSKGKVDNNRDKTRIIWQTPRISIIKLGYSELKLETYNGYHFEGNEAANKKTSGNGITVRQLIDKMIKGLILEKLRVLQESRLDNDEMLALKRKHRDDLIFPFKHHESHINSIETPGGKSCLKSISIPVEWIQEYK